MDGEDASATEFQERLDMLKAIGDPIFFRYIILVLLGMVLFRMPIFKLRRHDFKSLEDGQTN